MPRLVLLDPAIFVPPGIALSAAENARQNRAYVSFDEGIDRRYDESQLSSAPRELLEQELATHLVWRDGGYRYRYSQAAVDRRVRGDGFGAAAVRAGPRADAARRSASTPTSPTTTSWTCTAPRSAISSRSWWCPGGHTVLWDSFDETAAAIAAFLA